MSILGKYTKNQEVRVRRNRYLQNNEYQLPAVTREDKESISLKKGIAISSIIHPSFALVVWLAIFVLAILGIHLNIFNPPKPRVDDIEFVLVDKKDEPPVNKNTRFRADVNSRTGGINNPKIPVSMPSSQPSPKPAAASAPQKSSIVNKITQSIKPKKITSNQPTAPAVQTPTKVSETSIPKPAIAKPQPPTARPSVHPPMTPKPTARPTGTPFKVAVPSGGTRTGQYSTGPIGGSGTAKTGGSSGGSYSPNPSLAPVGGSGTRVASGGSGSGASNGSGYGRGGSGSGGGNPGGGGGRPGIDAVKQPDFGPYMRELTRKIKMNWDPPKGNESKRVVLLFKIAKDGRLLSCSVYKSSGLQNADNAAINAVKLAAPFRALPPEYKGANVDIQFTFDYNVFGASKY